MKTGFTNAAGYNIITSAERGGQRVIAVTMGHRTLKDRDRKVSQMMDKGLSKLALNTKTQNAGMYAELVEQPAEAEADDSATAQLAENDNEIEDSSIEQGSTDHEELTTAELSNSWAIQVGAFSNYTKARNYALKIKSKNLKKFEDTSVNIEPYATSSAVVYRSKITGFAKNDANEACKRLKKSKMSCIVVSSDSNRNSLIVATR